MNILTHEEYKNSSKNTIVMLGLMGHLLISAKEIDKYTDEISELIKLLEHY